MGLTPCWSCALPTAPCFADQSATVQKQYMNRLPRDIVQSSNHKRKEILPFHAGHRGHALQSWHEGLWLPPHRIIKYWLPKRVPLSILGSGTLEERVPSLEVSWLLCLYFLRCSRPCLPPPSLIWYNWANSQINHLNHVGHVAASAETTYVQLQTFFFLTRPFLVLGFIRRGS